MIVNYKIWEGTSVKSYRIQVPVFLFVVLHQFLYQQILFSQLSRISFNIIWKKFWSQIFQFLTDLPSPHNLTALMAKTYKMWQKVFPDFLSDVFWNIVFFLQNFIDKILQSNFWRFQLQVLWSSFQNIVQQQLFWRKHQ